jgi:hypothetical protein
MRKFLLMVLAAFALAVWAPGTASAAPALSPEAIKAAAEQAGSGTDLVQYYYYYRPRWRYRYYYPRRYYRYRYHRYYYRPRYRYYRYYRYY